MPIKTPLWLANILARITLAHVAIAVLAVFSVVQTIRLEGFNLWPIKTEGWKAKAERYQADLEAVKAAQLEAAAKARQARLEREAKYQRDMEQANAELESLREEWRDATDRFIANNRVRTQAARGASRRSGARAEDTTPGSADGPDPLPELAGGLVLVDETDVEICAENTLRLVVAQEWAETVSE